jgi:cytochrome c553
MLWALWGTMATAAPTPPVVDEMHKRFDALTTARDAIIQGKLDDAKAAIGPLTKPDASEAFPPEWRSWVAAVEVKAQAVAQAKDLQTASTAIAQVALACAQCHDANDGGPLKSDAPDVPSQTWSPGQNMPLHRWASDWMWTGLLANDSGAWNRGADELDNQPLALRFDKAPPSSGQRELEQLVYLIANKALTTDAPTERAALYGNLLGTCTQCHLQRGPKP